jgi:hypothetical protein
MFTCLLAGLPFVFAAIGCQTNSRYADVPSVYRPPVTDTGHHQPTLLFDKWYGFADAQEFAGRAAWPVHYGQQQLGETTFYQEYYYDYFGPHWNSRDHFRRTFRAYRTGRTAR